MNGGGSRLEKLIGLLESEPLLRLGQSLCAHSDAAFGACDAGALC